MTRDWEQKNRPSHNSRGGFLSLIRPYHLRNIAKHPVGTEYAPRAPHPALRTTPYLIVSKYAITSATSWADICVEKVFGMSDVPPGA